MYRTSGRLMIVGLVLSIGVSAFGATTVVEGITGSPGDWTYTFTLTNAETLPIWQWVVWFPTNPVADVVTAGTSGWAATDLATQGFFPEEYTNFWGCHVYDSLGNDLAGPNGEPGFYGTWASDYTSGNPPEYWDGDSWESLPDPLPSWPDPIYDAIWRGGDYGWNGSGANIQTSYGIPGIPVGGSGQFSVHSSAQAAVSCGGKSFSFNTTDYWYSFYDPADDSDHLDFEGSGTVIPEPLTMLGVFLGLGSVGVYIRRRRMV